MHKHKTMQFQIFRLGKWTEQPTNLYGRRGKSTNLSASSYAWDETRDGKGAMDNGVPIDQSLIREAAPTSEEAKTSLWSGRKKSRSALSQFAPLADTSITAKVGTPLLWSPLTPEEDQLPASLQQRVTKTFFLGQNLTQTTALDSCSPLPRKDPLPAPCKLPHCPCSCPEFAPTNTGPIAATAPQPNWGQTNCGYLLQD